MVMMMSMIMVMLMIVAAAGAAFSVIMVMLVIVFMLVMVLMIVMMLMAAAALFVVLMLFMVVSMVFMCICHIKFCMMHSVQNLLSIQIVPGSRNHSRLRIVLAQKSRRLLKLLLCHALRPAEHDRSRVLYLIIKKLTKVLHIHLALFAVYHHDGAVDAHVHGAGHILHCLYHIGQLAHAGGLDQDPIRSVGIQHLFKRRSKVSYQRAADTAGIHFVYLDAGVL